MTSTEARLGRFHESSVVGPCPVTSTVSRRSLKILAYFSMADEVNPYSSTAKVADSNATPNNFTFKLSALLFDLPSFPWTYRAISTLAVLATLIVFLSIASYTVILAINGFGSGQPGCLGAEFGWFMNFVIVSFPALVIGVICAIWSQRWIPLCVLTIMPPIWCVAMVLFEA
jgi:hypothetical protein